eukprot:1159018-Pelagomonas_calceolata.AAC.2
MNAKSGYLVCVVKFIGESCWEGLERHSLQVSSAFAGAAAAAAEAVALSSCRSCLLHWLQLALSCCALAHPTARNLQGVQHDAYGTSINPRMLT